jgi:hypothetical protein
LPRIPERTTLHLTVLVHSESLLNVTVTDLPIKPPTPRHVAIVADTLPARHLATLLPVLH